MAGGGKKIRHGTPKERAPVPKGQRSRIGGLWVGAQVPVCGLQIAEDCGLEDCGLGDCGLGDC
eukprot:46875-Alexandrium_andersonii.AAC.1